MNVSCKNYKSWFVFQIKTNREYFIKDLIEQHSDEDIKIVIFTRELIFERNNKELKVLSPLFPGYIFVHQKAEKALAVIKNTCLHEFVKPLCFKGKDNRCKACFQANAPCQVRESEMEFLLDNADESGIISLSYGIEKETEILIINGPLKQLHPKILWLNIKKKKAAVEIELFQRKIQVNLGFSVLTA